MSTFDRKSGRNPRAMAVMFAVLCAVAVAGCGSTGAYTQVSDSPTECTAQLRSATLPGWLSLFADHNWFVVYDPSEEAWHRWEVWVKEKECVVKDFLHPDKGVGGGPYRIEREWRGDAARRISDTLETSMAEYPHRDTYRVWPGPNCNTYANWILKESKTSSDLGPKGIGKDYLGLLGAGTTSTRTGVQLESPLVGLRIGLDDGVEVHVLCLTFGIDLFTPAIKTPLGRLGFPE
ncbi:MAG: DUF3750 domain-containing protein [Planctomycetota bacterium]|nr:DUF3750 domain-containing protein [Planctomycetota bacterium]